MTHTSHSANIADMEKTSADQTFEHSQLPTVPQGTDDATKQEGRHILRAITTTPADAKITWRSYLAIASIALIALLQTYCLLGPALLTTYIGTDLNATSLKNWIPIVVSLGQAVVGPFLAVCSDRFGNRKLWLGIPLLGHIIGAVVAGRAKSIGVLLVGQAFTGIGLGTTPLLYSVPSEMTTRRNRPLVQGIVNAAAGLGGVLCLPIIGGALEHLGITGWRVHFYVQAGISVVAVAMFWATYHPVNEKKEKMSLATALHKIDAVGLLLFSSGLALLLVGISAGDNPYPWASARPIALMCVGAAALVAFGLWSFYREDGIVNVSLVRKGNFRIAMASMFIEGIILFGYQVFFPAETIAIWETRPLLVAMRSVAFIGVPFVVAGPLGLVATKYRTLKWPLLGGFLFYTAGIIGFATARERSGNITTLYSVLLGIGFTPLLMLLVALAQLAIPHDQIATGTALLTSCRALGASVGPAFLGAILTSKTASLIPAGIAGAVLPLGLPPTSLPAFIGALAANQPEALATIPGVTPEIIQAGVAGLLSALANSFKWIWITLIPFSVIGILITLLIVEPRKTMNQHVDAPMEEIAKAPRSHEVDEV